MSNVMKRILLPLFLATLAASVPATAQEKSDSELRAGIEKHPWYSSRHEYRFLDSGVIAVDGYPTEGETWRIQNGLLYRTGKFQGESQSHTAATQIIEVNDRQLVEREISGKYKGTVEIMYRQRPTNN
jgi:hypothetical protein